MTRTLKLGRTYSLSPAASAVYRLATVGDTPNDSRAMIFLLILLVLIAAFIAFMLIRIEQHILDSTQIAMNQSQQLERIANGIYEVEQSIESLQRDDDPETE